MRFLTVQEAKNQDLEVVLSNQDLVYSFRERGKMEIIGSSSLRYELAVLLADMAIHPPARPYERLRQ